MNSQALWNMFLQTGSPELYVLFKHACKLEDSHASDDQGSGTSFNSIQ